MERIYYTLSFGQQDVLALWGQWPYWHILFVWRVYVMRCFGIVRTIPTSSSSWPTDRTIIRSHFIVPETTLVISVRTTLFWDNFVIETTRLWFTLWIGYYSGRKTSAIQLYLADLHWQCRTEHSILHWGLKLWDAISMWKVWFGDGTLCSDYVLYSEEGCTDTLCESLRSWEVSQLS